MILSNYWFGFLLGAFTGLACSFLFMISMFFAVRQTMNEAMREYMNSLGAAIKEHNRKQKKDPFIVNLDLIDHANE